MTSPRGFICTRSALLVLLFGLMPALASAREPGSAGFLSLRLGTGARAAGMGDAHVSLASDATAAYWNPAGLARIETTSLVLQHNEWFESVRMESVALGHATELGVFGVHFAGLYMDEIERIESASGPPTGSFNAYEVSVAGEFARQITEEVDAGLAVKWLNSKLDEAAANGWAVDLGARYRTRIAGLTFAGAAQHLGPKMKFIDDDFFLPATARLGADYQRGFAAYKSAIAVAADVEFVNDDPDPRSHLGVEYTYRNILSLRAGHKGGFDSQRGTFGFGVHRLGYRFDYAFGEDRGSDLGNVHRFSIGIDL